VIIALIGGDDADQMESMEDTDIINWADGEFRALFNNSIRYSQEYDNSSIKLVD